MHIRPSLTLRISMLKALFPNMTPPNPTGPKLPYTNPLPRSLYPKDIEYSKKDLTPSNTRPDTEFYAQPRFVQHIDDATIAALKAYYVTELGRESSPQSAMGVENKISKSVNVPDTTATAPLTGLGKHMGKHILDLCTSWTSHLPSSTSPPVRITGLGLNNAELAANPLLTHRIVQDLNSTPILPLGDESVDAVICSVSVDYLTNPVAVFQELKRVLVKGGRAHMAFGDRCFAEKVVGVWGRLDDEGRRMWVGGYFWNAGFEEVEEVVIRDGRDWGDKLFVVKGRKG